MTIPDRESLRQELLLELPMPVDIEFCEGWEDGGYDWQDFPKGRLRGLIHFSLEIFWRN